MEIIGADMKNKQNNVPTPIVSNIALEILAEFAGAQLKENELAISLIDLTGTHSVVEDYRGEESIYPASIVKLFYLVAAQQWLQEKRIVESDELTQACREMIVDSSNVSIHYIVDALTSTTGGSELPADEMAIWVEKRNAINRHFQEIGYANINVCQKTWDDGPTGRDSVFYGEDLDNLNKLTTDATARLLSEIVAGKSVSKERSKAMLALLERDFSKSSADPDDQATGFMGSALPSNARLWSKAGWMSTARHDAAYVELSNGIRFVLVAFISNHAKEYAILPMIAKKVIKALETRHG